ncbi:sulfotransferase [Nocardia sp. NBC_00881]|uniref:sulfotransferase family protein n=1 Tax=Nocardia sp. NBC_00881 TaxID=2975995 RepID=UPI00386C9611|nr:sulfotransferase [Nocardia sp. NBC_00881]
MKSPIRGAAVDPVRSRRDAHSAATPAGRFVQSPTFVLSLMRSGSTLLRCILDSHSKIYSPHELHLGSIEVEAVDGAQLSIGRLDMTQHDLKFILWDQLVYRQLVGSGKKFIVEKTPANTLIHEQILSCWPDARFIILYRNPIDICRSFVNSGIFTEAEEACESILQWSERLEAAALHPDSIEVRYEKLIETPDIVFRDLCRFIGVDYEPTMLDYGNYDHGAYEPGLGDWRDKIRSGCIQVLSTDSAACELPGSIVELGERWGYGENGER